MITKGIQRADRSIHMLATVAALVSVSSPHAVAAQAPGLETVLSRVAGYVGDLIPRFANIVAVETYDGARARGSERWAERAARSTSSSVVWRLRSDFLLVRYQMAGLDWMVFRDVAEVDGKLLDRPKDRLVALFAAPNVDTQRAAVIATESTRFHIPGGSFAVTNPLLVVALMQGHYQPRLRFTLGGEERVARDRVRVVRFEERDRQPASPGERGPGQEWPPLLGEAGRVRGSVWVEPETGRIVKTEARLGTASNIATTLTTFAYDERLSVIVPVEMRTTWTYNRRPVNGIAKYGDFRRFGVSVETHVPPPLQP